MTLSNMTRNKNWIVLYFHSNYYVFQSDLHKWGMKYFSKFNILWLYFDFIHIMIITLLVNQFEICCDIIQGFAKKAVLCAGGDI